MRLMVPVQTGVWAGLALAVVDGEAVLEIARAALGVAEIAQGRAAGVDGLGQDGADAVGEELQPRRWACRI